MPSQIKKHIVDAVQSIKALYASCGFKLTTVLMDGKFSAVTDELQVLGITINFTAANERVL